jgi:hypothetical protein
LRNRKDAQSYRAQNAQLKEELSEAKKKVVKGEVASNNGADEESLP